MANQTFHCPCGREYVIVPPEMVIGVRAIGHQGQATSALWRSFGQEVQSLLPDAQSSGRQGRSFDKAAAPLFGNVGPVGTSDHSLGDSELSPGESRVAKTYRQRSKSDVGVPLLANAVSSGLVGLITLTGSLIMRYSDLVSRPLWLRSAQFWIGRRWYVIAPCAFLATMAGLWFRKQLPDLLDDDKLIVSMQEQERRPEPAPIEIKPPSVEVIVPRGDGQHGYQDRRALLTAPKSDHSGLWRYCRALALNQAFPSWEGGKTRPGAKAYGFTEDELDEFRKGCVKLGLMVKPTKANQPWIIPDDQIGAFHEIARSKAEEWGNAQIGQQQREASYGI